MSCMPNNPLKDERIKTLMDAAEKNYEEHGAKSFDMAALPLMYDACFTRAEFSSGVDG